MNHSALDKPILPAAELAALIPDGASLMIGGFMGAGTPHRLLSAVLKAGVTNLTVIGTDCGTPGSELTQLIATGGVKKLIVSYLGNNSEVQKRVLAGEIEVELVPQGTLVERIRAGGAGLGGVLTQTGVGTDVAQGKHVMRMESGNWLVEPPLRADISLIACQLADTIGNAIYRKAARNLNPVMATAGKIVMAEPGKIVACGAIDPDHVVTPGLFVDYLVGPAE